MAQTSTLTPTATGSLGKTPLSHVIVYMADRKLTGSVVFQGIDGSHTIVYFFQGVPAKIKSSYSGTHLGRVLLQLGFIDEQTLDRSLAMWAQQGGLHGELLMTLGKIDRAQLVAGLREQVMRRMLRLFEKLNDETQYAFFRDQNLLEHWGGPEVTPVDPYQLLWSGLHANPTDPRIDATLSRLGNRPIKLQPGLEIGRFGFGHAEHTMLELIRARPAPLEALYLFEVLSVRQLKLLVYVLLITSSLDLHSPAAASSGASKAVMPPSRSDRPAPVPSSSGWNAIPRIPSRSMSTSQTRAVTPSAVSSQRPATGGPSSGSLPAAPPPVSSRPSGAQAKVSSPAVSPASPPPKASSPAPSSPTPSSSPRTSSGTWNALAGLGSGPWSARSSSPPDESVLEAARSTIRSRAQAIEKEDLFAVLGVSRDDPADVVRSAYFALAKSWHPDRLPPELDDVREEAVKVFAKMSEAFQTLCDPERRQTYLDLLTRNSKRLSQQTRVQSVVDATIDFQKAEVFVRKRDYVQAELFAQRAYEAAPQEADYVALYAWTLAMNPERQKDKDFTRPLQLLGEAIKLDGQCERAYFYRASLHKTLDKLREAIRDYRKVVELNPHNVDAAREVRLYEMRGGSKRSSSQIPAVNKSRAAPIDWSKDGVGEIFGKLFKR